MTDRPTILAVDPGLTTGWAALYPDGEFRSGETKGPYEFLFDVQRLIQGPFPWEMVVERYVITPETVKKSRQYEPIEIIGALKFFSRHYEVPLALQTPADAKAFSTDKKLKAMRWFRPALGHANDAARHLLCYSIRKAYLDPTQLMEA